MAIVGFVETGGTLGTINTEGTFTPATSKSLQHNFPAPGVTVWSRIYLQGFSADDGTVRLSISQVVPPLPKPPPFRPGIFQQHCTSVSASMFTEDCVADFIFTSEIFG